MTGKVFKQMHHNSIVMKTNNQIYIFGLIALLATSFFACKDDEGPSKTKMLTSNSWKLRSVNGSTNLSGSLTLTFESDADFKQVSVDEYGYTYTFDGEWKFTENETEIEIEYSDGDEWAFDLEELTSEKLVVEDAGDEYEFKH